MWELVWGLLLEFYENLLLQVSALLSVDDLGIWRAMKIKFGLTAAVSVALSTSAIAQCPDYTTFSQVSGSFLRIGKSRF